MPYQARGDYNVRYTDWTRMWCSSRYCVTNVLRK